MAGKHSTVVKIDSTLTEGIDAFARRFEKENLVTLTRSHAASVLVLRALKALEAERKR